MAETLKKIHNSVTINDLVDFDELIEKARYNMDNDRIYPTQ